MSIDSGVGGAAAIDMRQFHNAFFEEAAEHLATMESLLVGLDLADPSDDALNAIFRAAHSIKGGSGTFGFAEMAEVTHELESLLDKVRRREMALQPGMIDSLLEAGDLLGMQLAHYRGDGEAPPPGDEVCARIRAWLTSDAAAAAAAPAASAPAVATRTLDIAFPVPDADHASLSGLLEQLKGLGTLEVGDLPAPGDTGKLVLTTEASDDDILTIFGFVVEPGTVQIAPVGSAAEPSIEGFGLFGDDPPAAAKDEDPGFGLFEPLPAAVPATGASGAAPAARAAAAPKADAKGEAADTSIRVSVRKVDELINLVGELVITQAMLMQASTGIDPVLFEKLHNGLGQLSRNTRDLQDSVMSVRMMPIAVVFNRFPRVVRDVAGRLKKKVELVIEGETTELDKGLIEKIADPLTHLVRNSLDHGIEPVEQRIAAGKPEKGTITLRAFHRGGNVVIEVCDDGAGLRRDRILAKARERGMAVSDAMPDSEVWGLIFEAGFSTAEIVTDVSGRGVGMDVVKRNIAALGGRVDIESTLGEGSRMSIRLPLTLAILDGMSVGVTGETFIVPLANVIESLRPSPDDVSTITGSGKVIRVRGEYVPVLPLHDVVGRGRPPEDPTNGVMVVVESEGTTAALLVDELLGQHQVVIKSLEGNYRKVPGISGATIMGDGRVALILDVGALVRRSRH